MKIKTQKLQEMLSKSVKAAGNNKLIPLTSMLSMEVVDGNLCLTTTDSTNYLYVYTKTDAEEFKAVVDVDLFSKLISKITTEYVELTVLDKVLQVRGNGTYLVNLHFDDNGNIVKFPEFEVSRDISYTLQASVIKSILNICKPALAETLETPIYTGYYMHDQIIATNSLKISALLDDVFEDPVLLRSDTIDLLSLFSDSEIKVNFERNSDKVVFEGAEFDLFTHTMPHIEDYAIDAISSLLSQDYESSCKISRGALVSVLERLLLFVGPFDNELIRLYFTPHKLLIESLQSNGAEYLEYYEAEGTTEFSCLINTKMLLDQIKTNDSDFIEIQYGRDNALKLITDKATQIIALAHE